MTRITQLQGLSEQGKKLIAGCGKPHYTGEYTHTQVANGHDCSLVSEIKAPILENCVQTVKSGETYSGIGDEEFPLLTYILRDGNIYREAVQASPWYGGPLIFLAFKDPNGDWILESLWAQEEIQARL